MEGYGKDIMPHIKTNAVTRGPKIIANGISQIRYHDINHTGAKIKSALKIKNPFL